MSITITEADQEAAAMFHAPVCPAFLTQERCTCGATGAFARHREQARRDALDEAAKVAESIYCDGDWQDRDRAATVLATAIRALKEQPK